ncbi:MAG: helix-turn-helix transcriptional regulator [Tumebacillaceae bacterium]
METWSDILQEVTALSEVEKKQNEFLAKIVGSLVDRRKELGLSQRELAERSGIKQPVIARMESGASIPRLETVFKLAYVMGLKDIVFSFDEEAATSIAN